MLSVALLVLHRTCPQDPCPGLS